MNTHSSLQQLINSFHPNQSRVGVLCNQTAFVFEQRQYLIEVLAEKKVLKTVFVPEHGLFSELQDQEPLETTQAYSFWEDVSFVSLYGRDENSLKAAPVLLEELEDIVIDIQDAHEENWDSAAVLGYMPWLFIFVTRSYEWKQLIIHLYILRVSFASIKYKISNERTNSYVLM